MPHKRAKRSVRVQKRKESGSDLAPGAKRALENEEVPKGAARVLNAAQVQQAFRKRKRDAEEESSGSAQKRSKKGTDPEKKGAGKLKIMPGESMVHFSRRVEDSMRGSVRDAIQASAARVRQVKKEEVAAAKGAKDQAATSKAKGKAPAREAEPDSDSEDDAPRGPSRGKAKETPKEFERLSTSAPKRLNDIVLAPPQLKKLPRKAKKLVAEKAKQTSGDGARSLKEGVLSMAQKAMMEEERERAIRLYREMKKSKGSV
ncbi:uncharacterized protein BXZ73DRAFT_44325 [Epithele typhae]|uniref:uncharacterized protein n=1 Tax=Epithele typhae TaxID=378194 RepID=UPI0020085C63|nr:uncharacterized protein BXZ73DRAFT_44325 [Epithele typhae]KAH9939071.1 hypothetical protein BXZ73DRAFT_44325 [Epithele typhae]